MIYKCPRCGYNTMLKGDMRRHCKKKKICEAIIDDVPIEECLALLDKKTNFECKYCNKKFKYKSYLQRHIISCQDKHIEKLEKQNEILQKNQGGSHNQTIIGDNNNMINININAYQNTNYAILIDKELLQRCVVNGKIDSSKLLNEVHFKYPENRNVYISDGSRTKALHKWNGENFELVDYGNGGVESVIEDIQDYIDEHPDIPEPFSTQINEKCSDWRLLKDSTHIENNESEIDRLERLRKKEEHTKQINKSIAVLSNIKNKLHQDKILKIK